MNKNYYFKTYELTIETKTPLFIGSGQNYLKKDYIYDPKRKKIYIIDKNKMFTFLLKHELTDLYESFILNNQFGELGDFFRDCNISPNERVSMTDYEIIVGDALQEQRTPVEIKAFIKNIHHKAYIPGSSLKGALRTVLYHKIALTYPNESQDFKNNELNSIMQAISISDSNTVNHNQMILMRKDDISVQGNCNTLNIIRECIAPNTKLVSKLTIDTLKCAKIDKNFLEDAIKQYSNFYNTTYLSHFHTIKGHRAYLNIGNDCIILGGGSGYFGKNFVYVSLGKRNGLKKVANIMQQKFKKHHHNKDLSIGISPRMLKCGTVYGNPQHYGICKLILK